MPKLAFSRNRRLASLSKASDREVLLEVQASDELALDELIRRKTNVLVQVAYRILNDLEEARDVVQLAFVRVWDHRDRYSERWSPNTWIYRITTNLAIDHLRSRQSKERAAEPLRLHLESRHEGSCGGSHRQLGEREIAGIFAELASELTEKQRAVFVLREIEGLSSAEVGEIVGCRESTVRNHLFNARRVLKAELLSRYPEYGPAARAREDLGSETRSPKDQSTRLRREVLET